MELWRSGNSVGQKLGAGTDLGLSAGNDPAVTSSIAVAGGGTPGWCLWRLSGHDLQLHAFRVEGGYIEPQAVLAIFAGVKVKDEELESFGPYDVWVAECGCKLPIATLLPEIETQSCAGCRVAVASASGKVSTWPARDWSGRIPATAPECRNRKKIDTSD